MAAIAVGLCLAGCSPTNSIGTAGNAFEWAAAKQIHVGSTEAEVIALIGKPNSVVTRPGGEQVWIWAYANGWTGANGHVSISLRDGKVTGVPNMDQFG